MVASLIEQHIKRAKQGAQEKAPLAQQGGGMGPGIEDPIRCRRSNSRLRLFARSAATRQALPRLARTA
jgi:hypothetical protein